MSKVTDGDITKQNFDTEFDYLTQMVNTYIPETDKEYTTNTINNIRYTLDKYYNIIADGSIGGGDSGETTIIYPNGTPEKPAFLTTNMTVVVENPYPNNYIQVMLQVRDLRDLNKLAWCDINDFIFYNDDVNGVGAYGAQSLSFNVDNDKSYIVIKTTQTQLWGNQFGAVNNNQDYSKTPYRILVKKLKAIDEPDYTFDGVYGPIPDENNNVDLTSYASKYISGYTTITKLPEENNRYLKKVFTDPNYHVTNMHNAFNSISHITSYDSADIANWDTSNVTDMYGCFYNNAKLKSLPIENWNTQNVTNLDQFCRGNNAITSLDLSKWNTSKVTTLNRAFSEMDSVVDINCSGFDLNNCTTIYACFYHDDSLVHVDCSNWNIHDTVTDYRSLFDSCPKLETVDGMFVSGVGTDWASFANNCQSLKSINVDISEMTYSRNDVISASKIPTANKDAFKFRLRYGPIPDKDGNFSMKNWAQIYCKSAEGTRDYTTLTEMPEGAVAWLKEYMTNPSYHCTDMSYAFYNMQKLTGSIDGTGWLLDQVTNMQYCFANCYAIEEVKGTENWYAPECTAMNYFMEYCKNITSINFSKLQLGKCTTLTYAFHSMDNLLTADCSGWDTQSVTSFNEAFNVDRKLTYVNLTGWNTSNGTTLRSFFIECNALETVDGYFNFSSKCTDGEYFVSGCNSLKSITVDISERSESKDAWLDAFRVPSATRGNVTFVTRYGPIPDRDGNFSLENWASIYLRTNYTTITELPQEAIEWFNTYMKSDKYHCTNMSHAFYNMQKLAGTLDVTDWKVDKVTNLQYCFANCSALESIVGLDTWNPVECTDMQYFMYECNSITEVNIPGWKTSKNTNLHAAFYGMDNCATISLPNWDTSSVTNFYVIFDLDPKVTDIDITGWDIHNATTTNGMFAYCTLLETIKGQLEYGNNITDIQNMFVGSPAISSVNITIQRPTWTEDSFVSTTKCSNKSAITFSYRWGPYKDDNINLDNYYSKFIPNYGSITEIPKENADYLNDVFTNHTVVSTLNMLYQMPNIKNLNNLTLDTWDVSNVIRLRGIFAGLHSITEINGIKNWVLKKDPGTAIPEEADQLQGVFFDLTNVTEIDITGWDTSGYSYFVDMFNKCTNLVTIKGVITVPYPSTVTTMLANLTSLENCWIKLGEGWTEESFLSACGITNKNVVNFVS